MAGNRSDMWSGKTRIACQHCRRLKKKCTGDPGDGSGCESCKAAGRRRKCIFVRPESFLLSPDTKPAAVSSSANRSDRGNHAHQTEHYCAMERRPAHRYPPNLPAPLTTAPERGAALSTPDTTPVSSPSIAALTIPWPAMSTGRQSFTDPTFYTSRGCAQAPYQTMYADTRYTTLPPYLGQHLPIRMYVQEYVGMTGWQRS